MEYYCSFLGTICFRLDFEAEACILSSIDDPNIACVLGVNLDDDPWFFVREFSDQGDLTQYLQDHVAESSLSTASGIQTLRYNLLNMNCINR